MYMYIIYRVSYRILRLRGDMFLGIVNVCMRNRHCANHALLGRSGFFLDSCPETESGGFWQLVDYPTLVFNIAAF